MLTSLRLVSFASLFCVLGCPNPPRPAGRRQAPPTPTDVVVSRDVPAAEAVASTEAAAEAGAALDAAEAEGGSAVAADAGVRVFRVGDPACVRDPSREGLGASVAGYFSTDRLELEVRNVRHGCTPGPRFTARLVGQTLRVTYDAPAAGALARCACRHDQFLQVVGIPRGDYAVEVVPAGRNDAGPPVATGRIAARAR